MLLFLFNLSVLIWCWLLSVISNTDLIGDVMDGDVMHGCSVTLEQSVEVSPTMSETDTQAYQLHLSSSNTVRQQTVCVVQNV